MLRERGKWIAPVIAVTLMVSCASILGIEEPTSTLNSSGGGGTGANTAEGGSRSATGGQGGDGGSGDAGGVSTSSSSSTGTGGGSCDAGTNCGPTSMCVSGRCQKAFAPRKAIVLANPGSAFAATGFAMSSGGSNAVVGGTARGVDPGDAGTIDIPTPFVWLVNADTFVANAPGLFCHSGCNTVEVTHDVSVDSDGNCEIVSETGFFQFDKTPSYVAPDAGGEVFKGVGLARSNGNMVIGDYGKLSLAQMFDSKIAGTDIETNEWPLDFTPLLPRGPRVAAVSGTLYVAGSANHGNLKIAHQTTAGKTLMIDSTSAGFVGQYTRDAVSPWLRVLEGDPTSNAAITAITADATDVYVVGTFSGTLALNSPACDVLGTSGDSTHRMFVADLKASDGSCVWAHAFGAGDTEENPTGIAIADEKLAIVGSMTNPTENFGGPDLSGPSPLFLVILDKMTGNYGYSWAYGHHANPGDLTGAAVGVSFKNSGLFIAGSVVSTNGAGFDEDGFPPANEFTQGGYATTYLLEFPTALP